MKEKIKKLLTNKESFSENKNIFSLKTLFILALSSSLIFYRFVYIYIYNHKLSGMLYNYNISNSAKLYIEVIFLITWVIFISSFIFRLFDTIYNKMILPTIKWLIYILIKISLKIKNTLIKEKKIAVKDKYAKIKENKHKNN